MANSSLIDKDVTSDAVTGTFQGLAEGAQIANFLDSGRSATVSYIGGDRHDVTLTGDGFFVSLDGAGNLVLTCNADTDDAVTIQAAPATVESVITHATELIDNQVAHSPVRARWSREFRLLRSPKLRSVPTSTPAKMPRPTTRTCQSTIATTWTQSPSAIHCSSTWRNFKQSCEICFSGSQKVAALRHSKQIADRYRDN